MHLYSNKCFLSALNTAEYSWSIDVSSFHSPFHYALTPCDGEQPTLTYSCYPAPSFAQGPGGFWGCHSKLWVIATRVAGGVGILKLSRALCSTVLQAPRTSQKSLGGSDSVHPEGNDDSNCNTRSSRSASIHNNTQDSDHRDSGATNNNKTEVNEFLTSLSPPGTPPTTEETSRKPHTIPLDSSVSYSLHPYPLIRNSQSRTSLNSESRRAARSAHSLAVNSSRNGSQTSSQGWDNRPYTPSQRPNTPSHRAYSPGAISCSTSAGGGLPPADDLEDDYTFNVKSPDQPLSPTVPTQMPERQWPVPMPNAGTVGGAHDWSEVDSVRSNSPQFIDLGDPMDQSRTESPTGSVRTPLGDGDLLLVGRREQPSVKTLRFNHRHIFPSSPESFQRYESTKFAPAKENRKQLASFTRDFKEHPDPPGWVPILHPEGVLYFYNPAKNAVTEADLYDEKYYDWVNSDLRDFDAFFEENNVVLPAKYTLAMDVILMDDGSLSTHYCIADHDKRIVFFVDDFELDTTSVWQELKGVTSIAHIRHELEAQYWCHCTMYPNTMPNIPDAVAQLKDVVLHHIGDATTSAFSTSPYDLDELFKILNLTNSLKKTSSVHNIGAASTISRFMLVMSHNKFYNWFGTPQRRLYRNASVHGTKANRSWLIRALSPILFAAPEVHLRNLEKTWVDGILHQAVWVLSIKKLSDEWQEFILYATVLLNANVAFLTIQSIDKGGPYRSPIQIACYLSIISSIGSIVIGLLLLRQNRTRAHETASDVCRFLKNSSHPRLGLETLAILYSLPYALLLWGMVAFLASFAGNCFASSSTATRTITGTAWVIFAALVTWCVWQGWVHPKSETEHVPSGEMQLDSDNDQHETDSKHSQRVHNDPIQHIIDDVAGNRPGGRRSDFVPNHGGFKPESVAAQAERKRKWQWSSLAAMWRPLRQMSDDSERTVV